MISLNVLGMPPPNVSELIDWLTLAKPKYALVMDNLDLAARVAMTGTTVIYRRYRDDDDELAATTKPADFLTSIADVPKAYICQAGNESGGDQALLATWTAALIRQADAIGRRVAVGNWSVGNPDDEAIGNGKYDLILQALADTNGRHLLATHEYFWDKPAEEPWFIGRYRHFLQRADRLRIARPVIAITEHGRDLGGGPNDGWRGQGWTEADYARRLDEAQTVYDADGVCALVFCYGAGFGWNSFNVEGAPDLLQAMAAMNTGREDDVGLPGWTQAKTKQAGARVNVRSAASISAPVVTTIVTGDWVKKLGAPIRNGSYTWQPISVNTPNACPHGYAALEVVEL